MVQRRIGYYFPRPPQPEEPHGSLSFLDLPYKVRHRVYILVGLVRFCPINLNQEGPRARALLTGEKQLTGFSCFYRARRFYGNTFGIDDVPGCECPPLPVSLLYVSRAASDEVSRILYSENSFTVSRSDAWGLKPLRNLSATALSSLRCVTVRLNNCECVYGFEFDKTHWEAPELPPCHPLCRSHGLHDKPLCGQTRQGRAVLREWQDLIDNKLAVHLRLHQKLRLDLVCDAKDLHTASQVVACLSRIPGPLRDCSIRLSQKPGWESSMLARTTALGLLGENVPSDDSKNYSYYLPSEILSRILGYSDDLVAPYDLEWRPDKGLVPDDCCANCTATLDCCTCSTYHGAYSSSCTCWKPPTSIFLVSRQVYEVAMSVFYGRNRFIVLPKGARLDGSSDCCDHRDVPPLQAPFVQFLKRVPQHAHRHIRFLGLALLPFAPDSVALGGRRLPAWADAIALISQRLDILNLRLALYLGSMRLFEGLDYGDKHYIDTALSKYRLLLPPSLFHGGLRDLFIYLQWPHTSQGDGMDSHSVMLEKEIMGANYDSEARGKWSRLPRLWYNGPSREGKVFAPDGRRVWPNYYYPSTPPSSPLPFEYASSHGEISPNAR